MVNAMFLESIFTELGNSGAKAAFDLVMRLIRTLDTTAPRPGDILKNQRALGVGTVFPIRGKLKKLPEGNEILLLTQDV